LQTKLENREYNAAQEVAEDMRLIFTNCYRYNPPDSDVVKMAKKLQDVFELRFAKMPEDLPVSDSVDKMSGQGYSGSEEDETSGDESGNESEEERESKLKALQDQVEMCKHSSR